jgi:endonuclease/exonuclease/phosphatase family metal-dependent hydrolase
VRVATFNIRHGEPTGGGRVDPAALGRACRDLDAEVLALQEVDRGMRRSGRVALDQVAAAASGMTSVFGPALTRRRAAYGNALLVRGTASDVEVLPLPGEGEPRSAVLARVRAGATEATAVATHLGVKRSDSLAQMEALFAAVNQRAAPTIVLGDFNRPVDAVEPYARAAGLELVVTGPTYPAPGGTATIDFVLVRGFSAVTTEEVATGVSDHLAVVVDLVPISPG